MPAALTEIFGTAARRVKMDLRPWQRFRIVVGMGTIGFAGSVIGFQFSIDNGVTWYGLDNGILSSNSTMTAIITNGTNTMFWSDWADLSVEAKIDDCLLRVVGVGGDAIVDPSFVIIGIELRD